MDDFSLILPNIRSCHNVGAMFRTADAFGINKLYLCGYTAAPPKPQIDKVALGAEMWIPWDKHDDPIDLIKSLKEQGVSVVALEHTDHSVPLQQFEPTLPLALVVGHEVDGVDDELLAHCDAVVHIPMRGQKESLNVSVAAGIAMYDIDSKRQV